MRRIRPANPSGTGKSQKPKKRHFDGGFTVSVAVAEAEAFPLQQGSHLEMEGEAGDNLELQRIIGGD